MATTARVKRPVETRNSVSAKPRANVRPQFYRNRNGNFTNIVRGQVLCLPLPTHASIIGAHWGTPIRPTGAKTRGSLSQFDLKPVATRKV